MNKRTVSVALLAAGLAFVGVGSSFALTTTGEFTQMQDGASARTFYNFTYSYVDDLWTTRTKTNLSVRDGASYHTDIRVDNQYWYRVAQQSGTGTNYGTPMLHKPHFTDPDRTADALIAKTCRARRYMFDACTEKAVER